MNRDSHEMLLSLFREGDIIPFTESNILISGALLCVLVVFVLAGFIAAFFPQVIIKEWFLSDLKIVLQNRNVRLVFAIIGAIIFSLYIVFDTQMMMGGNHKVNIWFQLLRKNSYHLTTTQYSLDPEEYVFAALNLYLDIINLFLYILQIIGASRDWN